jgi:hypothetical protein
MLSVVAVGHHSQEHVGATGGPVWAGYSSLINRFDVNLTLKRHPDAVLFMNDDM